MIDASALARDSPVLANFRAALNNFKAIADYETGPGAELSAEDAAALESGRRFVILSAAY